MRLGLCSFSCSCGELARVNGRKKGETKRQSERERTPSSAAEIHRGELARKKFLPLT